jgi:hypothetical protein
MQQEKAKRLAREETSVMSIDDMPPLEKRNMEASMAIDSYFQLYEGLRYDANYVEGRYKKFSSDELAREATLTDKDDLLMQYDMLKALMAYTIKEDILPSYEELRDMKERELAELGISLEDRFTVQGTQLGTRLITISDKAKGIQEVLDELDIDKRLENAERRPRKGKKAA